MMLHAERYLDALSSDMRGQLLILTLPSTYFQHLTRKGAVNVTYSDRMKQ